MSQKFYKNIQKNKVVSNHLKIIMIVIIQEDVNWVFKIVLLKTNLQLSLKLWVILSSKE
jgi:hypothetical protein